MRRIAVLGVVALLALFVVPLGPSAASPSVFSPVLFRNVNPVFAVSAAQSHQVAVLAVGALPYPIPRDGYGVPFVVRNGTNHTIGTLQGYATIWGPSGQLVGDASDQGFNPTHLLAGQEGFAYVYLEPGTSVPRGSTIRVSVAGAPLSNLATFFTDLPVLSVSRQAGHFTGIVRNPRPETVQGPGGVTVYCVTAQGRFLGEPLVGMPGIPSAGLTPAAIAAFSLRAASSCPTYVVGSTTVDLTDLRN